MMEKNILNLLFCDSDNIIKNVIIISPFSSSDHNLVSFQLKLNIKKEQVH